MALPTDRLRLERIAAECRAWSEWAGPLVSSLRRVAELRRLDAPLPIQAEAEVEMVRLKLRPQPPLFEAPLAMAAEVLDEMQARTAAAGAKGPDEQAEDLRWLAEVFGRLYLEATGELEVPPPAEQPIAEEHLARALDDLGRPTQARLVRLLVGRDRATFLEVKRVVHQDELVDDDAVGRNARRTTESVQNELGSTLEYSVRGREVVVFRP